MTQTQSDAPVLVVDDNARNRMVIEGHLEAAGHRVVSAASGERAVELFEEIQPALVLLDILMPGMDGFETCERIRGLTRGKTTPIVFLTALDQFEALIRAESAGGDDFLTKPVRAVELLMRVRSLLRIRKLNDAITAASESRRHAAENRATRNLQRYRTLFDATNDGVIVFGADGTILEGNRRILEYLGREDAGLGGLSVVDLYDPSALEAARLATEDLKPGAGAVFETELVRYDGSSFPAEISATRVLLEGVLTEQWLVRDISVRREAEEKLARTLALEQAANDLLVLVSSAQDSFMTGRKPSLVFEDVLHNLLTMTGSEYGVIAEVEHDVAGPSLQVHALAASPGLDQSAIQQAARLEDATNAVIAAQGAQFFEASVPGGSKDSTEMRFLFLPINKGKKVVGVVGLANREGGYDSDLVRYLGPLCATCASLIEAIRSERLRRASEKSLRDAEVQLRQAQKLEALGALAGGVAHDFNNLLATIVAFSELVRDDLPPDHPGREDLEEVLTASNSAAELTGQLLAFARRRPVEPQVLDFNATIERAQRVLQRTLGEGIELQCFLGDEPLPVMVDPVALEQIVFNLCANAREAMGGRGKLTLEVGARRLEEGSSAPVDYVTLAIRDTGPGIPDDILTQIFEPFFSTKGEHGAGLGLATAYGIVKQAGGDISVETVEGEGTVFTVLLPVAVESPGQVKPAPLTAIPDIPDGRVALVVEDHPPILRIMARALRKVGVQVFEASTVEEGLAKFEELGGRLDLLVSDVVLPGQSSASLFQVVRETSPELPVLLTSGYVHDEGRMVRNDAHTGFLPKPFSARQLTAAVARLLAASDAQNSEH